MNALLETFRCQRCDYGWRTTRTKSPSKCPSCTTTDWDKPYIRQIPGKVRIDTPQEAIERLMQGVAEVLRTSNRCSIGKDLENRYVVIPPLILPRWRATPDRYGTVVAHLDRDSTADDLGLALFGPRWTKRGAA